MTSTSLDVMTNLIRCGLDPAFDKILETILLFLDGFAISSFLSVNKEWNQFLEDKLRYSLKLVKLFDKKLKSQWMNAQPSRIDIYVALSVKHMTCDNKVLVTADDETIQIRNVKTGEIVSDIFLNDKAWKSNCFPIKVKNETVKEIFTSDSIIGAISYPTKICYAAHKFFNYKSKTFGFVNIWSKKDFQLLRKLKFELLSDDQSEEDVNHKMKVANDVLVMVQQEEQGDGTVWHPIGKRLFFFIWDVKNCDKDLQDTKIGVEFTGELFTPARDVQIDHDGKLLALSTCLETNVFDMKSGVLLYKINMLDPRVNRRNSDDVLLNMQVRRTVIRYPVVIIDCEHRYTGMSRIFVYNLEKKKTVCHHAWDERNYVITDDFTIRVDDSSKYDFNVFASEPSALLSNIVEKMKITIQDTNFALKLDKVNQSTEQHETKELIVEVGAQMKSSANKTSIAILSRGSEKNCLSLFNFWMNKN